jgi:hypothetical protein
MDVFNLNELKNSAPQCPTYYSPAGNGDVLVILVHRNIRVSDVIVSGILDSDHLPIIFYIQGHVIIKDISKPTKKFTDWNRF